jgi:RimJ/RimL family protein N-acetyltransferase
VKALTAVSVESCAARIEGEGFLLRPWTASDAPSLVRNANDKAVSRCLSDRFPFPYTDEDAQAFLSMAIGQPKLNLAIEVEGAAVGGIGLRPGEGELRIGCHVGYWLGRRCWGRGLMSRILPAYCDFVFRNFGFERLHTTVMANNPASARVLEKSGFLREGTLRRAAIKGGEVFDMWMYAMIRPHLPNRSQDPAHE